MAKPVALFVVGTRPDAIKSAPVVLEFKKHANVIDTVLVSTGQHREMLAQALSAFGLQADIDLDVMQHGQTLADVTSRILEGLDRSFSDSVPNIVFAQGDTTTTFVAGLASFYRQIPFAHIEAGLRTDTVWNPFPEEFNRRAIGLFAALHFPPTAWARRNLLDEKVDPKTIFVTGNTGIDAIKAMVAHQEQTWFSEYQGRIVLLTTHRRENWGAPQKRIAKAALQVLENVPDALLVVPMHRNPKVRETLTEILGSHQRVSLIEPPDYQDFVKLLERSDLVLTDSGGVQEEAPTFGLPVLVLRDTTERPEGVQAGTAKLVGTDVETIVAEATALLTDEAQYAQMAKAVSPYGDGRASQRIRYRTLQFLGIESQFEAEWT